VKIGSLKVRLILLAVGSISIALMATTFVLNTLFYTFFEERIFTELDQYLIQLTANLEFDGDIDLSVAPLSNPQFDLPFSGLYWQVIEKGETVASSRSLWGNTYSLPPASFPGERFRFESKSSQGVPLIILGWSILLGEIETQRVLSLSIAVNASEVVDATSEFRSSFIKWLSLMFFGLILAAWVQVRIGLAPLESLRQKVEKVRSGEVQRLSGPFPQEVLPLANEVDELLDLHDRSLAKSRERASDLAHGLKTPLTVMLTIAHDLRKENVIKQADEIETQVESMRYYIERELARVRTRADALRHTDVSPVIDKMVSAIRRFPRHTPLLWEVTVQEDLSAPFDEHDLSEILGNILDNARKWAQSVVRITSESLPDGFASIVIEDDGRGVPDDVIDTIINRGERLDAMVQGSGLGLAICSDLAESYGANLTIDKSSLGGLRVTISWNSN